MTTEGSIDTAIQQCKNAISRNRLQSLIFFGIIISIPIFSGLYFITTTASDKNYLIKAMLNKDISKLNLEAFIEMRNQDKNINYLLYALLILMFGVFTSLYRFHLKEIAKYEHYLIGFIRIRIAANNSENGFDTEVRQSLTQEAFTYETKSSLINNEKRIESPLPGHIGSDISSSIINKVLDSIEIVTKKKN